LQGQAESAFSDFDRKSVLCVKAGTHQTNVKELVATKADVVVSADFGCIWAKKLCLNTADSQPACTFCTCKIITSTTADDSTLNLSFKKGNFNYKCEYTNCQQSSTRLPFLI